VAKITHKSVPVYRIAEIQLCTVYQPDSMYNPSSLNYKILHIPLFHLVHLPYMYFVTIRLVLMQAYKDNYVQCLYAVTC